MEAAGDFFQPRREVHRGADAGEVEPVAAADIAVENFSDMQGDAEAEALDRSADRKMHRFHAGAGFARRLQHTAADLTAIADIFVNRKHRQQPVAHEFQNLPAMAPDRRYLAIKIAV